MDDCSSKILSNRHWYGVWAYIGNYDTKTSNEEIGLLGHNLKLVNTLNTYDYTDFIKVGGSIKVPETIGKVRYIVLSPREMIGNLRWHICNVGIFTCYCSNFRATRSASDYSTSIIELKSGTNIET